eukprot:TRINITY_DN2759_c0_g1_i5.p1 TRINITY_DN2759_c0_g1~~TRINITY_DN2759_c0_g1_i5.p1  ORF type:complete len:339 (+),score=80.17 TRINITY_DN2759_c0_g1_i5:246-1262(+)
MGTCSTCGKAKHDEYQLPDYHEILITIGSYTKGLKTRIREVMTQSDLTGVIHKTIHSCVEEDHVTPIHTRVIAGGKRSDLDNFSETVKEIVDESIHIRVKPLPSPELTEEEKKTVTIIKTDSRIENRKSSDAGIVDETSEGLLETAMLVKNQMKTRAKQVLNVVSDIPLLSEYTNDLREKWSLLVKEQPREFISAKSLFHPFSVYNFAFYPEDGPNVMKICLEWKLHIPFDAIELYTMAGIPLIDSFTLIQEKQCIFVDTRVTKKFFTKETRLKKDLMKITKEPFVYHSMALHEMTFDYMMSTFKTMYDVRAQNILKKDLKVSDITAVKILALVKGHR